jgi:nitrate reductase beta subunit
MGVLLYDADKIESAAAVPDDQLLAAQLDMILDPNDPEVIEAARDAGIGEDWLDVARRSPLYQFVKVWGIALPLHPEFRTMAMMFYVPPLSPVVSTIENELVKLDISDDLKDFELFDHLDRARLPVQYLANLFSVENEDVMRQILRKMYAVRIYKRHQSLNGGTVDDATRKLLASANLNEEQAEAMYKLTTVPTIDERFVLPPYHREMSIEELNDPLAHRGAVGTGFIEEPRRGW